MRSEDRERAAADGHQGPGSSGSNEPRSPCVGAGAGAGAGRGLKTCTWSWTFKRGLTLLGFTATTCHVTSR